MGEKGDRDIEKVKAEIGEQLNVCLFLTFCALFYRTMSMISMSCNIIVIYSNFTF